MITLNESIAEISTMQRTGLYEPIHEQRELWKWVNSIFFYLLPNGKIIATVERKTITEAEAEASIVPFAPKSGVYYDGAMLLIAAGEQPIEIPGDWEEPRSTPPAAGSRKYWVQI